MFQNLSIYNVAFFNSIYTKVKKMGLKNRPTYCHKRISHYGIWGVKGKFESVITTGVIKFGNIYEE